MPSTQRRLVVAINPAASFGRHLSVGPEVARRLAAEGYDVSIAREANWELLEREVRHAVSLGTDGLVVVGGDGMATLGVNALVGTDIPLGIVAAGTGNDFARALGLPFEDPMAGLDHLLGALERDAVPVDTALVRHGDQEISYGCVLSAGFDARVNERANRMRRPRGASRYTIALVRELATFRPRRYRLTIDDGEPRELGAMLISVANGTSIGGGMRIVPQASLDDGLLDVFVVHPISKLELLRVFPKVFAGTHIDHPAVEFVQAKRVRLESEDAVAYADGERIGALPVEVEVRPASLRVFR
ncbi:diacylglycerol/lipid kinase family protein [Agromyces seonyuensis]|uniref:YegS/Rv2252/BmrU family lipid kinase n=1 Tax=Agromyces seonyuensis TaxID=2662446 RepID=A0A6I4NX42_9MICO|nr:YegS/Rv2252/BmrU family lipid kinase [Agromyces seonyuensis]MWB97672.1 YegS/Rv2252/BmrU family lipid kinase [Agromyces seonyuensis]